MHQTFYIDIDEEITSVIDRMRKSRMKRLVFVIPQRALVLQSVVNLKLLKRQAERIKKQIMIVSQDEQTRTIAEKIGISFQTTMQGISEETEYKGQPPMARKSRTDIVAKNNIVNQNIKNSNRDIGSSGYYDLKAEASEDLFPQQDAQILMPSAVKYQNDDGNSPVEKPLFINPRPIISPNSQKIITPQVLMEDKRRTVEAPSYRESSSSNDWRKNNTLPRQNAPRLNTEMDGYKNEMTSGTRLSDPLRHSASEANEKSSSWRGGSLPKETEKFITSIYKNTNSPVKKKAEREESVKIPVGKGIKKTLLVFSLFALLTVGITLTYLFVPKAKVVVTLKEQNAKFKFEATAKSSQAEINIKERLIPVELIDQEVKKTVTYQATGSADGKEQKASGKVMIYNEFNSENQSLVATTRLITSDGKIFRLVKGVTVPGMAKVGSETKPGVVEVEVTADQPGEEYNIGPAQFKIPGFQGGPKYDKFYAKSEAAMAGGGTSQSNIKKISKNDLTSAKSKAEQELKKSNAEDLKSKTGSESRLIEESVELGSVQVTCPSEGQVAESFECTAISNVKGFIVQIKDLEELAANDLVQSSGSEIELSNNEIVYHFVSVKPDFSAQTISFKVEGSGQSKSSLDEQKLKTELTGMGRDNLPEILKKYPQIKEIMVDFWPNIFINKIPIDPDDFTLEIIK
jgi:hypothetical protein